MRRLAPHAIGLAVLALAGSACGVAVGPSQPDCDEMSVALIMQAQAVPGTGFAACLHELQPGWEYEELQARSGRAQFWLDSDRMGFGFLAVTLEASCDTSAANEVRSDEDGIPLYVEVLDRDVEVPIVVVPEGDEGENQSYANDLVADLRTRELRGRPVTPAIQSDGSSTATRIASGLDNGQPVLVVGPMEREENTVELHLPVGKDEAEVFRSMPIQEALDRIEPRVTEARYQARWYYPFSGGCVTYSINASGDGVSTIVADIQETLGLASLAEARHQAEELGLVVP